MTGNNMSHRRQAAHAAALKALAAKILDGARKTADQDSQKAWIDDACRSAGLLARGISAETWNELHTAGLLTLARCDCVGFHSAAKVAASEVTYGGVQWHYVVVG